MEKLTKDYRSTLEKNRYLIPVLSMIIYLSIAIGITVLMKSITSTSTEEVSIGTNAAEVAFYNKKYDVAISEYNKLQEKEEWPIWNMKIAEIYSVKGEFVKSNEILEAVYETRNKIVDTEKEDETFEAKDRELTNYIVFTWLMNGESKKALEYGELFLQDYPNDKNLIKTMVTVYMVNGNKDKAKEIVKNYPTNDATAGDLADLASMNMLIGNIDEGLNILKDAWYKDKDEVKIFDVIAQTADYNDKTYILDKISKLEKKEPDEIAYKMWTAKIYSMSKELAHKGEDLIDDLEKKDVGNINLMLIKANMYQSQGEIEKSKEVLKEIINNNPDSFIGYYAAAWQAYNNEQYDQAFKNCVKSILINKDYTDNYGVLIPEIMAKQNKSEDSEPYLRTALYKEPFNYSIIVKSAEYYGNTVKDTTKALNYYDLASKVKPNDAEMYYNMALIKINIQREDEAIQLLKKSISLNNKISKYHRALGAIYLNKEKNEEGIKEIRSSYTIDKNDILTLNNAGCYYIAIEGDVDRGMINLKAAYDGINEKTSSEDKEIITENYNRVKNLLDTYNKNNGAALKVSDFKLFY